MTISECCGWLRSNDGYLLLTHKRPDGDTLGSATALCRNLRLLGKTAHLYKNPEVTENHIDYTEPYFAPDGFLPNKVISVDVASENQLPTGFDGVVDLCVDHHVSNTFFAKETLLGDYSSCGELILELIRNLELKPDSETADALYIAVSTDTGCFCYSNTTAGTLRAAAELLDLGAKSSSLNKKYFRTASTARIMLEREIFGSLRSYRDGKVNIASVTLEMMERAGATENDCEDLASLPGRIAGSAVSVLIREVRENHCKISVRTMPGVDANAICRRLGGGGHNMAAGCGADCAPDEAERLILEAINEELNNLGGTSPPEVSDD